MEALTNHDFDVICFDSCTSVFECIKCELQTDLEREQVHGIGKEGGSNTVQLVSDLCKSCRFLIGFEILQYPRMSVSYPYTLNGIMADL